MSCCGGSCGCGSGCQCGSGCTGCGKYMDISETITVGVAPVKMFNEGSEMGFGAENDCKCGSNCTCDNCGCGK